MRRWRLVLGAHAAALLLAAPAWAITIIQVGANGAPTMDGGAAVAIAASGDPSNTATATGGEGGSPGAMATAGGDASATAQTLTSGFATATAEASGGVGGNGLEVVTGGPGGAAWATAVAENASAEAVEVVATATGGSGGNGYPGFGGVGSPQDGGAGGAASLGRVYGASSGGGDVRVVASVTGGDGGDAGETQLAGVGSSVLLQDAVDGETSGALYLQQRAVGGESGSGENPSSGSAESSLTREKSAASLELVSEAFAGGRIDALISGVIFPSSGAGAAAVAEGKNLTGSAATRALALAGTGAGPGLGALPGIGGAARLRAAATTLGDGDAVRVGEDPYPVPPGPVIPIPPRTGARGGRGGHSPAEGIAPGRGGDAESLSIGSALGDSTVYVFDYARGGSGGGCALLLGSCRRGADGGDANSQAIGEGAGHSSVEVHALAEGGRAAVASDDDSGQIPRSGVAIANASASGLGEVRATAEARTAPAGTGFGLPASRFRPSGLSGDSAAFATARGSSGSVASQAQASGGPVDQMLLHAGASIVTGASVEAKATAARPFSEAGSGADPDVFARATALPLAADSQQVFDEHAGVAAAFAAAGVDEILALGRIDMLSSQIADVDSILLSAGASFEIEASTIALAGFPRPGNVWIGFFAPELAGDGFESLRVRLGRNGASVLDLVFTDPDEASSELDQLALDLGAILTDPPPGELPPLIGTGYFTADFELRVRDFNDAFGVGFIVGSTPVPEPSTLLLVALGLAVLARRERR